MTTTDAVADPREPLVLAIETATGDTEVALRSADGPLGEIAVRRGRRHVESLHPAIERICADAGVELGSLTAVAVDIGPGLFTGLRVGVTAAKTLAFALDIPLAGVTSLDVLAAAATPFAGPEVAVLPVVDMRRGEVAWSLRGAVQFGPPDELGRLLASLQAPAVLLVGEGALVRGEEILAAAAGAGMARVEERVRLAGESLATPPAAVLARLGLERARRGETEDVLALVPLYLREADVAINWESRPEPAAAG
jgi:tRNA threonylcarbamoyladenosine biosynthesis protein TsaB